MRRFILASTLFLAGCATAPQQQAAPQIPEITATPRTARSGLVGLTAQGLVRAWTHEGARLVIRPCHKWERKRCYRSLWFRRE